MNNCLHGHQNVDYRLNSSITLSAKVHALKKKKSNFVQLIDKSFSLIDLVIIFFNYKVMP